MNNVFYRPDGNPEVWNDKPEGYYTPEEWAEKHPAEEPDPPTIEERIQILKGSLSALDMKYYHNEATKISAMLGDTEAVNIMRQRHVEHEADAAPIRSELRQLEEGQING